MKTKIFITIIIVWTISLLFPIGKSLLNPAAVYCKTLGYKYIVEHTQIGDIGYCILPNNQKVDAWKFIRCEEGKGFGYCELNGYGIYTENDTCFCVLPNGTKIEMLSLMNLDLRETVCGDGVCGFPENYATCPQDCPSGSFDGYCDGVKDGICDKDCILFNQTDKDPDCQRGKEKLCLNIKDGICEENCPEDPDCKTSTFPIPFWIVPVFILAISILLFIYFFKKSKISKVYPPKS